MAEWNPFSHACVDNPFPIYRELRDEQPVYHNEKMGFYALSRFDDVLYGLLHPALFKSSHGITLEHLDSPDQLLNKDDPEHLEHRKIVARAFTVSAIGKLEPKIREIAGPPARPGGRPQCHGRARRLLHPDAGLDHR